MNIKLFMEALDIMIRKTTLLCLRNLTAIHVFLLHTYFEDAFVESDSQNVHSNSK